MKRLMIICIVVCFFMTGCNSTKIGTIENATDPSNVIVTNSDIAISEIKKNESAAISEQQKENYVENKSSTYTPQNDESSIIDKTTENIISNSNQTKYYDLAEKIFPEDSNYSISRPPYKYGDCRSVKSINEFREFINAPNAETIDEGFYYSFVKLIKQNGYIPELYYKGESLFEDKFRSEIDAWSVENGNVKTLSYIEMHPEKNVTGVGYTIPEVNLKGDTIRFISVYYLREEWLKYAKERPYLFSSGKKNPAFYNQKEVPNYEGILKTIKINGKETVTCKSSKGTFFYYVCDEYLIKIFNPDGMDFYELAKNLSIKKVPLEQ